MQTTTVRLKFAIWVLLSIASVAASWVALSGVFSLVVYFQTGANPSAALNIVPNKRPQTNADVSWRVGASGVDASIDPQMRDDIELAYSLAWLQGAFSHIRGEPWGLKTYFTAPALGFMEHAIRQPREQGFSVWQIDSRHEIEPHFVSADRSIISFTDHDVLTATIVRDDSSGRYKFYELLSNYDVLMLLHDGNWRVQHLVRSSARSVSHELSEARVGARASGNGLWWPRRGTVYTGRVLDPVEFWRGYDSQSVVRDLEKASALGLDAVQVPIPFDEFGRASVDEEYLVCLEHLLASAYDKRLRVVLSTFEGWHPTSLLHWNEGDRHIETLVERFKAAPALGAWLIDASGGPSGDELAQVSRDAWTRHIARLVREADSTKALGISFSRLARFGEYAEFFDFAQWVAPAGVRPGEVETLPLRANEPLLVRLNATAWQSYAWPSGAGQYGQARDVFEWLSRTARAGGPGLVVGRLFDTAQGSELSALLPSMKSRAGHAGLLNADGTAKPAGSAIAEGLSPPAWCLTVGYALQPLVRSFAAGCLLAWALSRLRQRRRARLQVDLQAKRLSSDDDDRTNSVTYK